jgi:hypothetical protein
MKVAEEGVEVEEMVVVEEMEEMGKVVEGEMEEVVEEGDNWLASRQLLDMTNKH